MRRRRLRTVLMIVGLGVAGLAGCTAAADSADPAGPPAPPPPPPAACLLDPAQLAAITGVSWTPDQPTASDTRCVYDPGGPVPGAAATGAPASGAPAAAESAPGGPAFLAVEIGPAAGDPAGQLSAVAAACKNGSRAPLRTDGFICRFRGDAVFAAVVRPGRLVTVATAGVPAGTTAARLVLALQQQLDAL